MAKGILRELTKAEMDARGFKASGRLMENGEIRVYYGNKGTGQYVFTEMPAGEGWQRSHRHNLMHEAYMVQSGHIFVALFMGDGSISCERYEVGGSFVLQPGVAHNVYMGPRAVTHVVKYGNVSGEDWIPCPELDHKIKRGGLPQR